MGTKCEQDDIQNKFYLRSKSWRTPEAVDFLLKTFHQGYFECELHR